MKRLILGSLLGVIMFTSYGQDRVKAKIYEKVSRDSSVIISDGDTILRVNENYDFDSVVVNTKRFHISVGESGVTVTKQDSIPKRVVTRFMLLDIGFAGYLQNGSFNLTPDNEFLDTKFGKSRNVNLQLFTQRVRFAQQHMNFSYGLMFEFNKYRLANDVKLVEGIAPLTFTPSETEYRKNKLKATYLYIPLMLGVETKPEKMGKSFRVRAGVYGGILTSSKQKLIGKITDREKIKDDFNLTKFRYGMRGEIGYGFINFYVHYAFSPMFKENQGPDLNPINMGIMLLPF